MEFAPVADQGGQGIGIKIVQGPQRLLAGRQAIDGLEQRAGVKAQRILHHRQVQERFADLQFEAHGTAIHPLQIGPMHHAQALFLDMTAQRR